MNYRKAFFAILVLAVVLGVALALFLMREQKQHTDTPSAEQVTTSPSTTKPQPEIAAENLSPVQLSPQRLQSIGVKFAEVVRRPVRDELRVTGNVDIDEGRLAYIQTRFPGWIEKVFADATYKYVHKGQPLFTVYSQELVSTQQEFLLALQNRKVLEGTQTSSAAKDADWLLDAARQRLRQWNVPDSEIARLEKTGQVQPEMTVESSVSGYITERNALPNQFIQPETKLYTIADLSEVWVYAEVFQTDVGRLAIGDPATVTVDAYPGRSFAGRVQQILPQIDLVTRTVRVRLIFANPGLLLKPGMYVNVSLGVPLGIQLMIPVSGVLQSGTRQIAFIDHGNGYLEPRPIELGQRVGDSFIVLKGVRAGEQIVSSANFLIDSESQLQSAIGQFAPPPPGAGGAGGIAAVSIAQTAKIDFTTSPSPPHKGTNIFRVKLADSSGKSISGAKVTVTFFMPAMPAMGMASMKTAVTLTDRGNGAYEGTGELGSGGTWRVTITVQKNGQTIGTKLMNVSTTGGM
jgi:Cu(I)/Ag(I) efflux system membrane fusion protein/cobalt-zinc-cadmium efflux system membrane fusion protein